MPKELRIVMLEDQLEDAMLAVQALSAGGLDMRFIHVATRSDFEAELSHSRPDVVLSDHGLPDFDGFTALEMLRAKSPATPFIFVSGKDDEQTVAAALERGADGYVSKQHLSTLAAVVKQELHKMEEITHWQHQAEVLEQRVHELQSALEEIKDQRGSGLVVMCAQCRRIRHTDNNWVPLDQFFEAQSGFTISHGICPECAVELYPETFPATT